MDNVEKIQLLTLRSVWVLVLFFLRVLPNNNMLHVCLLHSTFKTSCTWSRGFPSSSELDTLSEECFISDFVCLIPFDARNIKSFLNAKQTWHKPGLYHDQNLPMNISSVEVPGTLIDFIFIFLLATKRAIESPNKQTI